MTIRNHRSRRSSFREVTRAISLLVALGFGVVMNLNCCVRDQCDLSGLRGDNAHRKISSDMTVPPCHRSADQPADNGRHCDGCPSSLKVVNSSSDSPSLTMVKTAVTPPLASVDLPENIAEEVLILSRSPRAGPRANNGPPLHLLVQVFLI